jgi:hypothetical protein
VNQGYWDMSNGLGYKGLKVYQIAYNLAMEVFQVSKAFPNYE